MIVSIHNTHFRFYQHTGEHISGWLLITRQTNEAIYLKWLAEIENPNQFNNLHRTSSVSSRYLNKHFKAKAKKQKTMLVTDDKIHLTTRKWEIFNPQFLGLERPPNV